MQKYIGAMVRKSIRVVLVAKNDLFEVAGNPAADEGRAIRQLILIGRAEKNPSSNPHLKKNETIW